MARKRFASRLFSATTHKTMTFIWAAHPGPAHTDARFPAYGCPPPFLPSGKQSAIKVSVGLHDGLIEKPLWFL